MLRRPNADSVVVRWLRCDETLPTAKVRSSLPLSYTFSFNDNNDDVRAMMQHWTSHKSQNYPKCPFVMAKEMTKLP